MTLLSHCFYKTLTKYIFTTHWTILDGAFGESFQLKLAKKLYLDGHNTSNRRRFNVDITSIR